MSTRCVHCAGLTVEALVDLARTGFEAQEFPKEAYYPHHDSLDSLEQAARHGCDFCQLILGCFLHTPAAGEPVDWPSEWNVNLDPSREGQSESMYSIAKRLEVSDVKLSINATHLYSRQPIDDVQVFDEIMVQVGLPFAEDEDRTGIWGIPVLKLTMSAPKDNVAHVGKFRIGRYEVDPDLGSPRNHGLTRQWISDCRNSHQSCLSPQVHELPTRVIDVGDSLDSETVRLVLTKGRRAEYVALSHCWGGAVSPLLTTETLSPFQDYIGISELPANFRDAITITRQLGLRFLWIDSLCIQQDSKSDWDMESKKMGLVYRNSTVTISALTSTGSKEGILRSSQTLSLPSTPVTLKIFNGNRDNQRINVRRRNPNEEDLRGLDSNSALTTRGWTLQEYMLSPRHVLYGREMVYWRCPQHIISSDGLPPGNKSPQTSYTDLTQVIYSDIMNQPPTKSPEIEAVLNDYYELVNAYSMRRLTYGSDKLPAFSGLAQRLHQAIGGDYIAGLWSEDFRRGLLWVPEMSFCQHNTQSYRAPTWTWAVTDDIVLFEESAMLKASPSSAQLLEYAVNPRARDNPYGEISSAKLVLKALTKPLVRSRQVVFTYQDDASLGDARFDEPVDDEEKASMRIYSLFRVITEDDDYLLSIIARPGDETDWELDFNLFRDDKYILMLVHTDDNVEADAEWSNSPALCLILRQTPGGPENTYERVGFARVSTPKLSWLRTWAWQILVLV